MNKLSKLFLSEIRAELLRLFFGLGSRKMYRAEIIGELRFAGGSVEEELEKLVRLELLLTTKDGNRRYYDVNPAHPLYPELRGIVLKTVGLHDILLDAIPAKGVRTAFVFGSLAAGSETGASDVDLMIIGTVSHRALASDLRSAAERIGREINPHFLREDEFLDRLAAKDHFLSDVVAKPKLFIRGTEHEFVELVKRRLAAATPDQS